MVTVAASAAPELGRAQFEALRDLLGTTCGIRLHDGKSELVRSRLLRRLRALGLGSFDAYVARLDGPDGAAERVALIDALTTNTTSFFRETHHFRHLAEALVPAWAGAEGPVRIWSAGCSLGMEPYSIAMVLRDRATALDVRVLATDVSTRVLAEARAAVYDEATVAELPARLRARHFEPGPAPARVRVVAPTRALVSFARLNLMHDWPMRGPFHAIFCRNVMIYFDRATQRALADRYAAMLVPGGVLFLGHAETLGAIRTPMRAIGPSTYQRAA